MLTSSTGISVQTLQDPQSSCSALSSTLSPIQTEASSQFILAAITSLLFFILPGFQNLRSSSHPFQSPFLTAATDSSTSSAAGPESRQYVPLTDSAITSWANAHRLSAIPRRTTLTSSTTQKRSTNPTITIQRHCPEH